MPTPSAFSMQLATASVAENAGHITVAIDRAGDLSQTASVEFATIRSGSSRATPGSDYKTTVQRVAFAAGESRKTVDVVVNDNATTNSTKTFGTVIRYPENAEIGSQDVTMVSLTDDDVAPPAPSSSGGAPGRWLLVLFSLAALFLRLSKRVVTRHGR